MRHLLFCLFFSVFTLQMSSVSNAYAPKKKSSKTKKHKKKSLSATSISSKDSASAVSATDHQSESRRERRARRRRERKERKERARQERRENKSSQQTTITPKEPSTLKKWADIEYPASQKKKSYRIEVLAPLYLDDLVKNGSASKDIPEKAAPGLNFYKGLQLAADSLKRAGFNFDIYVHDVSSARTNCELLINNKSLDSADLILGMAPSKDAVLVAQFAKSKKINFVSVTAPEEGTIRDNEYTTIISPSSSAFVDWLFGEVEANYIGKKSVLLYPVAEQLSPTLNIILSHKGRKRLFANQPYLTTPQRDSIARYLDTSAIGYIYAPFPSVSQADALLKWLQAAFPQQKMVVVGAPEWHGKLGTKSLLPNIELVIPRSSILLIEKTAVKNVTRAFKREYGGKMKDQVFIGYELMFWYGNLLARYGNIFNRHYSDVETAPFTDFEIKPHWDEKGNISYLENTHFLKYKYTPVEK
jgi:hypothetical protein